MFGSRPLQFTDWCTDFSVATDMVDPEAGTVAPLLLLDKEVVTLKVRDLSGLEHILLKEAKMCFPQVDEVPV